MSIKTERKLTDLYHKLMQDGYNAKLLGQNGKPLYTAFEYNHRMIFFEYDEVSDLYGIGQLFDRNPMNKKSKPTLGFSENFRIYDSSIFNSYNSISRLLLECDDYIEDPAAYQNTYEKWVDENDLSLIPYTLFF